MSQWLDGELAAVRGELVRTDAKCSVLTAIATGAAAFAATRAGHGPGVAGVLTAVSGVVFAAAVLVLLAVLRPRLGTSGWCRFAGRTAAEIRSLAVLAGDQPAVAGQRGYELLSVLAGLTAVKYGRLRVAVDLIGAGIVLLAAGTAAGVIA